MSSASACTAPASPRSASTGGWMPRTTDAQVAEGRAGRGSRASRTSCWAPSGSRVDISLGHAEAHPEGDQPGLRAVVQVALDPAAARAAEWSTLSARVSVSVLTRCSRTLGVPVGRGTHRSSADRAAHDRPDAEPPERPRSTHRAARAARRAATARSRPWRTTSSQARSRQVIGSARPAHDALAQSPPAGRLAVGRRERRCRAPAPAIAPVPVRRATGTPGPAASRIGTPDDETRTERAADDDEDEDHDPGHGEQQLRGGVRRHPQPARRRAGSSSCLLILTDPGRRGQGVLGPPRARVLAPLTRAGARHEAGVIDHTSSEGARHDRPPPPVPDPAPRRPLERHPPVARDRSPGSRSWSSSRWGSRSPYRPSETDRRRLPDGRVRPGRRHGRRAAGLDAPDAENVLITAPAATDPWTPASAKAAAGEVRAGARAPSRASTTVTGPQWNPDQSGDAGLRPSWRPTSRTPAPLVAATAEVQRDHPGPGDPCRPAT